MIKRQKKSPYEIELEKLQKQESKYIKKRMERKDSKFNKLLDEKVPDTLQITLNKAFAKAFTLVFEKGTKAIEKTYKREELEKDQKIRQYAAEVRQDKKSLKQFSQKAKVSGAGNMFLSGTAGIGMGLLGMGIPDIPIFTAMLLRSIYEIALQYGFSYDSEEEKHFILMLIRGALSDKEELPQIEHQINYYIDNNVWTHPVDMKNMITKASACLSGELLYMKFLQGIPLVGAVGGAYDMVYIKQVTEYAELKYRRRFYTQKWNKQRLS